MREKIAKALLCLITVAIALGLGFIRNSTGNFEDGLTSCSGEHLVEQTLSLVPKMPVKGKLSVYFIDVGQGDSALLVSPNGKTMLIDSGESMYADRIKSCLDEIGIDQIDVLIGTHSHSDHVGAMPQIINEIKISSYVTTAVDVKNDSYSAFLKTLKRKRISIQKAWSGETVKWDKECKATVLSPVRGCEYSKNDANDGSLMLRIEYGETAFIFTADVTVHAEQLSMFHNDMELFKADVLKVAHHGSTTSSSLGFVETVDADIAIISVGAKNRYGHPDFDIINRLQGAGCDVFRTDERGTIAVFSDGKSISTEFQKKER